MLHLLVGRYCSCRANHLNNRNFIVSCQPNVGLRGNGNLQNHVWALLGDPCSPFSCMESLLWIRLIQLIAFGGSVTDGLGQAVLPDRQGRRKFLHISNKYRGRVIYWVKGSEPVLS